MNEQSENLKWLVENVPNINESMSFLITELEETQKAFDELDSDYINLIKENKRYREALEFINEELELVLHSNKGLAEKMFYIENSKRKITEVLEGESNEQRTTGRIKKDEVIV